MSSSSRNPSSSRPSHNSNTATGNITHPISGPSSVSRSPQLNLHLKEEPERGSASGSGHTNINGHGRYTHNNNNNSNANIDLNLDTSSLGGRSKENSVVRDDNNNSKDSKEGLSLGDDAPIKRKIACMACRNIKLRCLFAHPDSAPLDPCRRCSRLSLDCIYKPKRRPVKPGQEREEQPVLGKNGKVMVGEGNVSSAGAGAGAGGKKGKKKTGTGTVAGSAAGNGNGNRNGNGNGTDPAQSHIQTQQASHSLPPIGPGEEDGELEDGSNVSGSGSGSGDEDEVESTKTTDRSGERPARPGPPVPTFSWSDFDTSSASRPRYTPQPQPSSSNSHSLTQTQNRGHQPGMSHLSNLNLGSGLSEIDPVLTNFAMSPLDPSLALGRLATPASGSISASASGSASGSGSGSGSMGYGSSGFGLDLGMNTFLPPHTAGSNMPSKNHIGNPLDPGPLDRGGYIGGPIGSTNNHSHVRLAGGPGVMGGGSGNGDVSVPHGSTPSSRAYSQHDPTSFSPNLLPPGLNNNSNSHASGSGSVNNRRRSSTAVRTTGSPPPGGKQKYPMALTTMLEVMSHDAKNSGQMLIGGTPISAERERRDGRLIERDYAAAREQDRRASEDDRYDDSPHSHGYASLHRDSHPGNMSYSGLTERDGRRRMTLGGEEDDPTSFEESARPRKRMRWDDQVQMEANRKRHDDTQTAHSRDSFPELNGLHEEQPSEGMEDPVSLGLVAPIDVPYLFDQYHSRLNTYIALLDPAHHTPEYCLRTSPILFTAILAVAAQIYLPEIYKPLRKRANDMLGIAFARGDAHIGMCQALSMLSVWKEANDKSTWLRVGYAIRVALELGLDIPRKTPLPEDEFQAREILNGERTFRQLTAFDRTMFLLHGRGHRMVLPGAIHSTREWCEDHPEIYCYADVMLGCSSMHGDLSELLNTIKLNPDPMATPSQGMSFKYILHNASREHQTWQDLWFGPNPPGELHPISRAICFFYGINFRFEYEEFNRRFLPYHENIRSLARTISLAVQMLRYIITDLSPHEVILFAPDIITFRAAQAGVFLARHMNRMDPSTLEQVQMVFRDMARECKRFARGQNTAFYQAKFFASLLRISSVAPTRVATRENTPNPGRTEIAADDLAARLHQAGNQVPDFSLDLDLVGFDDSLTIDALLQESHDWFSVDLLSHMNDPYWNPPPVITGYDQPQNMTTSP